MEDKHYTEQEKETTNAQVKILGTAMLNHWQTLGIILFKGIDGFEHARISGLKADEGEDEDQKIQKMLASKHAISRDIAKLFIENFGHWNIDPHTTTRMPLQAVFPILLQDFKNIEALYTKLKTEYNKLGNAQLAAKNHAIRQEAEIAVLRKQHEIDKEVKKNLNLTIANLSTELEFELTIATKWSSWIEGRSIKTNTYMQKDAPTKETNTNNDWNKLIDNNKRLILEKAALQKKCKQLEIENKKIANKTSEMRQQMDAIELIKDEVTSNGSELVKKTSAIIELKQSHNQIDAEWNRLKLELAVWKEKYAYLKKTKMSKKNKKKAIHGG